MHWQLWTQEYLLFNLNFASYPNPVATLIVGMISCLHLARAYPMSFPISLHSWAQALQYD
jgi:hypothetical protein